MLLYKKRTASKRRFLIIALFATAVLFFCYRFCIVASSVSEAHARYIATMTVNTVSAEYLQACSDAYGDIVVRECDADGNISAISTDIVKINQLQSEIASRVLNQLSSRGASEIKIPIMNIVGMQTLTGWGPTTEMSIMPAPNVIVNFEDSFTSAGINQTMLSVKLRVRVDMLVKTTGFKRMVSVEHELPVVQIVLVGNVPGTYASFENR